MSLENISAVEALLGSAAAAWAEAADHGPRIVGQSVSVLVVFSSEPLCVVFARGDWALLGPFVLMRQHVSLEILDVSATCCNRAQSFVGILRRAAMP